MATILVYATEPAYLTQTIDTILDRTPISLLDEIILCADDKFEFEHPSVRVVRSNKIGCARAWNACMSGVLAHDVVFMRAGAKVGADWLVPLINFLHQNEQSIVSPVVYDLDVHLWASGELRWRRPAWRWDLRLYDRRLTSGTESPALSAYCLVMRRSWFEHLGGFDSGMVDEGGEDIELTLRSWLLGGSAHVVDDSEIAATSSPSPNLTNLMRTVEAWMPTHARYFYQARDLDQLATNCGRLHNLVGLQELQQRPFSWFLQHLAPELNGLYDLRGSAAGKTIAVVAPGPSLDCLNSAFVNRHDLVVGVDFAANLFACDFIVTDAVHVVGEVRNKAGRARFVLPTVLANLHAGRWEATSLVLPEAIQYELGQPGVGPTGVDPPFCNYENAVLSAIHFALFLRPKSITVFGFDNQIINGKSHTSRLEYYDNGEVWPDSEGTRRRFAVYERAFTELGQLARKNSISLIRVNHV